MDIITALAVSISLLGGIATFAILSFGHGLQLWAVFIAWACFYHAGGKEAGLTKTIVHNIFGGVLAAVMLVLTTKVFAGAIGVPAGAAVAVVITVFVAVIAAKIPTLSDIPATVLGYAPVAAFALLLGKLDPLVGDFAENPFLAVVASLIVGALFGYVSEKAAGALAAK